MMSKDWRLVINLANSVCGVALLALPHCFSQCGVVLGSLLLLASAYLTIQSCKLLVKVIFHTNCYTYEGMALILFGSYGKVAMEISSIGLMLGTCSAFFVIVTDLAPVLVANLMDVDVDPFQLRLSVSFLLGVFVVFPLCLLKRLETLSYLSAVSLIFYASLTLQLLSLSWENMSNEETLQKVLLWRTSGIFNIVPIFALAFSCHLQLCYMIGECPEPTPKRMNSVVQYALSIVGLVYGSMALFGHIAFCTTEVSGDILTNFGDNVAAQTTRIGFTVAVLISFPFFVTPCRACIYSVIFNRGTSQADSMVIPQNKFVAITACIICITWFIAVTTPNVEIVLSLTGAVCGSIVCFVFPALAYMSLPAMRQFEWKPKVVLGMGLVLMVGGSLVAMSDRFNDEGAVAAIHELAGGAPEPILQQLMDDRIQADNEERVDGHVEKDADGLEGVDGNQFDREEIEKEEGLPVLLVDAQNEDRNQDEQKSKVLKEQGEGQPLPVDLWKEDRKSRPHDAVFGNLPNGDAEEVVEEKGVDALKLEKKFHPGHDLPNDNDAVGPDSPVGNKKVLKSPLDVKKAKNEKSQDKNQAKREKIISDEQEKVLGQQKQVLLEQRELSDKQEKVSDQQEKVSDELKVISEQQKQVIDQQKEISEQQEQVLSRQDEVIQFDKDLSVLKDELSELKVKVSDLVLDKNPMEDTSSTAVENLLDKDQPVSMKSDRKSKLDHADFSAKAPVLADKDGKKLLHNPGTKRNKKTKF